MAAQITDATASVGQDGRPVRHDYLDRLATEWLPEPLYASIQQEEYGNFMNLVEAVEDLAAVIPDSAAVCANQDAVLAADSLIPLINTFLKCKSYFDIYAVHRLYKATFSIAVATECDLDSHVKWSAVGTQILRFYAQEMRLKGIELDWEVYWDFLQRRFSHLKQVCADGTVSMMSLVEGHSHCRKAKTLFAPSAASKIWDRLKLPMALPAPTCISALVLLVTFFPHKAADRSPDGPWHSIAEQAVKIWLGYKMNAFSDRLWLCFLARLAKWDTHGTIQWPQLLRPICLYVMYMLRVPVGTSRGPPQSVRIPTDLAFASFTDQVCNNERHALEHFGKLLVYAVRPNAPHTEPFPALAPIDALRGFAALLEHFYHAPNSGRWSKGLADLVDSLHHHLAVRRLLRESTSYWTGDAAKVRLDTAAIRPVAEVLFSLASIAMFHKDANLSDAGPAVISGLAYVLPEKCVAFAVKSVHESLASAEAVHRLEDAIVLLSEVVRPLLLYGLPASADLGEFDAGSTDTMPQTRACMHVGRLMEALLPAIDANDEAKMDAALCFYNSVLCSAIKLSSKSPDEVEAGGGLPVGIDLRSWAVDLTERLFDAATTLQGHQDPTAVTTDDPDGDGSGTSWFSRSSIFLIFAAQLFQKLPAEASEAAFDRVIALAQDITEPGTAAAAAVLVLRGASAFPEKAAQHLLRPLVKAVDEDLAARPADDVKTSRVTLLAAKLTVVSAIVPGLGQVGALQEYAEAITKTLLAAAQVASPLLADTACVVMTAVMSQLCSTRLRLDDIPHSPLPGFPGDGVASWVGMDGTGAPQPQWRYPTESDFKCARHIASTVAAAAAAEVEQLASAGLIASTASSPRHKLYRALKLASSVVCGLMEVAEPPILSEEARTVRQEGSDSEGSRRLGAARIGTHEDWKTCAHLKDAFGLALTVLEKSGDSGAQNPTAAVCLADEVMRVAYMERLAHDTIATGLSKEPSFRGFCEPPTADLLRNLPVGSGGNCYRTAPCVAAARVSSMYIHRRSFAANDAGRSTRSHPGISMHELEPQLLATAASLVKASRHRYMQVCVDLAHAAVPGLVAVAGLLDSPQGEWVLSVREGLPDKLQVLAAGLTKVISSDWQPAAPASGSNGARKPRKSNATDVSAPRTTGDSVASLPDAISPCTSLEDALPGDVSMEKLDSQNTASATPKKTPGSAAAAQPLLATPDRPHAPTDPHQHVAPGTEAEVQDASKLSPYLQRLISGGKTLALTGAGDAGTSTAADSVFAAPVGDGKQHHSHSLTQSGSLTLPGSARDRSRRQSGPHSQSIDLGVSGYRVRVSLPNALEDLTVSKTSLTQSEAGQDQEEEDAAKCTENNQHVVCGALDMLEQLRVAASGGRMLRRQPALANVLFLLTFASLRYDPMEVKVLVNNNLHSVCHLFLHMPAEAPGTFQADKVFGDTALLLAARLQADKLHWREAFMTQVLLTHILPLTTSQELATAGIHAFMHAWMKVPSVIVQHAASYGLAHAFILATRHSGNPLLCNAAAAAAAAAVASTGASAKGNSAKVTEIPKNETQNHPKSPTSSNDFGSTVISTLLAMCNSPAEDMVGQDGGPEPIVLGAAVAASVDDTCDNQYAMAMYADPVIEVGFSKADSDTATVTVSPTMRCVEVVCGLIQFSPETCANPTQNTPNSQAEAPSPEPPGATTRRSGRIKAAAGAAQNSVSSPGKKAGSKANIMTTDSEAEPTPQILNTIEEQLKGPLEAWAASEQKDRLQDGSVEKALEVVVIEVCLGMIKAATLGHANPQSPSPSALQASMDAAAEISRTQKRVKWVLGILTAGYSTAATEKAPLWSSAIATSARVCANEVLSADRNCNKRMHDNACAALSCVLSCIETLTATWTGSNASDLRHASLSAFLIDHLTQVEISRLSGRVLEPSEWSSSTSPATGDDAIDHMHVRGALLKSLEASVDLVSACSTHALQSVRSLGARVALVNLSVLDSPLLDTPGDPSEPSSHNQNATSAAKAKLSQLGGANDLDKGKGNGAGTLVTAAKVPGRSGSSNPSASRCQKIKDRMRSVLKDALATASGAVAALLADSDDSNRDPGVATPAGAEPSTREASPGKPAVPKPSDVAMLTDADLPTPSPSRRAHELHALPSDACMSDGTKGDDAGRAVTAQEEAAIGFLAALMGASRTPNLAGPDPDPLIQDLYAWVLQAQAVSAVELQPLMHAIRGARRLPVMGLAAAPPMLACLLAAAESPHWKVRITAVFGLQPFWHRNYFSLTSSQIESVTQAASCRLLDSKVEVRQAAANLLTGLLQCMPAEASRKFREQTLDTASDVFPARTAKRRRIKEHSGSSAAPGLLKQHACALSLSAVLLSRPYVIEEWTSDVLMALTRAAQAPAPVKVSATEALGNFRKTQEGTSRLPLRERLDPDVWDALRDAAVQSSYFA